MIDQKWIIQGRNFNGWPLFMNTDAEGAIKWEHDSRFAVLWDLETACEVARDFEGHEQPLIVIPAISFPNSSERTYTAADIERIVAIACREQREACQDAVNNQLHHGRSGYKTTCHAIQNAPAPSAADVLAEFEKMNNPSGDTQ